MRWLTEANTTKRCNDCESVKPATEFHLCCGRLSHICKACHRARGRANYKAKSAHYIEKITAYRKAHWGEHQVRAANYYQRNKPEIIARRREHRNLNLESIRAYWRKWRAENPARARNYGHFRRALERNAEGRWTANDIATMFKTQGGKCHYCRQSITKKYHIDHIVPLIEGGNNWPENIQLLCPSCNTRKNRRDAYAFANDMGRLF